MALSDTFTTLGNTIINLVNSKTAHKQNQLVAGDGIQITENSEVKNADICVHPDIEAAFQSVIDELEASIPEEPMPELVTVLLEDLVSGDATVPEVPFLLTTNLGNLDTLGNVTSSRAGINGTPNLYKVNFDNIYYMATQSAIPTLCQDCSNLREISFASLISINMGGLSSTFKNCTSLKTATFPALNAVGLVQTNIFEGCTNLQHLYFPAMGATGHGSDMFTNMLLGVTGCTVHFPENTESGLTSGDYAAFSNGFGGTDTVILFDLPSTETSGDGGYGDGGYS